MDPTVYPVIAYSMLSKSVSAVTLRDIAQYQIVPLLSALPGVVRMLGVQGGQQREVEVLVDPRRLAMHGLALADVATALGKANVLTVVGRMQDHDKLLLLALDDTMKQLAQVRDTVVQAGAGGIVRVGDLAEVTDGIVPQWIRVGEKKRGARGPTADLPAAERQQRRHCRRSAQSVDRLPAAPAPRT